MKNLPLLIGTLLTTLILVVGVAFFLSNNNSASQQPVDQQVLMSNTNHVKGATESARVTIVEFSDLQCPACKAFEPLLSSMVEQYPHDVQLVYRHFPLSSIHPFAQLAAQASEVAAEHDKFWEWHDLLFEKQEEWSILSSTDEVRAKFVEYAEQLEIDKTIFLERIESDRIKEMVARDIKDGNTLKVSATPTLYVNGQKLSAPQQLPSIVADLINSQE